MNTSIFWMGVIALFTIGCGSESPKPVDIYPEDMCAHCRMIVSDPKCASEIITTNEVFKFDDLACLEAFKQRRKDLRIEATYVKDYESQQWLRIERAICVTTDVFTPMGSGKIAFTDSSRARSFLLLHAPRSSQQH